MQVVMAPKRAPPGLEKPKTKKKMRKETMEQAPQKARKEKINVCLAFNRQPERREGMHQCTYCGALAWQRGGYHKEHCVQPKQRAPGYERKADREAKIDTETNGKRDGDRQRSNNKYRKQCRDRQ